MPKTTSREIKQRISALAAFVVLSTLLVSRSSPAELGWDPFDGVTKLVGWFTKLNDSFEQVVVTEKRGQLLRKVDRMRRDFYALEADTRVLLDNVPTKTPTEQQREHLSELVDSLMQSVAQLGHASREVGADLRLNDAIEVDDALTSGIRTRGMVLTFLHDAIEKSTTGTWNATEVRQRLDVGLRAVKDAQLSVTAFRKKLS